MEGDIASPMDPLLEKELRGHRNSVTALSYNPKGNRIASSSLDNSVLLWDFTGAMKSYRFIGHDEAVMDVVFSPNGKYMASASRDKTVRIWVPSVTGSTGVFKAHSQTVRSVEYSPDNSKLLTASDDKIIKLWSCENNKFIASFVGHTNWVRCARLSKDGSIIGSCSDDKTIRLWNPSSGEMINAYKDSKGHGICLEWHPTGCYVAIGTSLGNVKLYDVRTHTLVQYYRVHSDAVMDLSFHPSGSYVITASKDGNMKILDLLEGHPIYTLPNTKSMNAVSFSPGGEAFASAGDNKLVNIWKTNFTELSSDVKENNNMALNPSEPQLASQSSSNSRTNKGTRAWYLCYHSDKIPVSTFVHMENAALSACDRESCRDTSMEGQPNANSTMIDPNETSGWTSRLCSFLPKSLQSSPRNMENQSSVCESPEKHNLRSPRNIEKSYIPSSSYTHNSSRGHRHKSFNKPFLNVECQTPNNPSCDVGCQSHIPRCPPSFIENSPCDVGHNSHIPRSPPRRSVLPQFPFKSTNCLDTSCLNETSYTAYNHMKPSCNVGCSSNIPPCPPNSLNSPPTIVGHVSHQPRCGPPKPARCSMPSVMANHVTIGTEMSTSHLREDNPEGDLFGLIKLDGTNVCYTNGTIEWVGRKRTFPINSGFKTLDDGHKIDNGSSKKKSRRDLSGTCVASQFEQCDCVDVLPTVNAIVDHLNALHEAVDIAELRLGTLESAMINNS